MSISEIIDDGQGFESQRYRRFLLEAAGATALLLALATATLSSVGAGHALPAAQLGCVISLVAAIIGSLPIHWSAGREVRERMSPVLGSIALRPATAVILGLVAALGGLVAPKPLWLSLLLSHSLLLVVDTRYAIASLRRSPAATSTEKR